MSPQDPVVTESQAGPPGTAPSDPEAFIARAELLSNAFNVAGALSVYAPEATLESLTDGTLQLLRGEAEREAGIALMFAVSKCRGLKITKELVGVTEDTIVNTWRGTIGKAKEARGFEIWRFDAAGAVDHHRMYTALDVRSDTDPLQRLRLLFLYPRTAFAFMRVQRSLRRSSPSLSRRA